MWAVVRAGFTSPANGRQVLFGTFGKMACFPNLIDILYLLNNIAKKGNCNEREFIMTTDLDVFRATVSRRRPERILCYASFDLQKRVIALAETENLIGHYGMVEYGGGA